MELAQRIEQKVDRYRKIARRHHEEGETNLQVLRTPQGMKFMAWCCLQNWYEQQQNDGKTFTVKRDLAEKLEFIPSVLREYIKNGGRFTGVATYYRDEFFLIPQNPDFDHLVLRFSWHSKQYGLIKEVKS